MGTLAQFPWRNFSETQKAAGPVAEVALERFGRNGELQRDHILGRSQDKSKAAQSYIGESKQIWCPGHEILPDDICWILVGVRDRQFERRQILLRQGRVGNRCVSHVRECAALLPN